MSEAEVTPRSGLRDEWLTFGVGAVVVAAVLLIGGVHATTQVALSALTLILAASYILLRGRRGIRPVPFAGLAAVAIAFTALQLVPLPVRLVALLSPQAFELRSQLSPDARIMPLTLDAPATLLALMRGAACLALLIVSDGLIRTRRQARRLLWLLALLGAGVAAIAFAQRIVGARQILGLYTPRGTPGFGFFGTFVDVNHCASLLALGTLVAAGLAVERQGRLRAVLVACAALSGAALLFTGSRGALVGLAVGGVLLTVILAARAVGVLRATVAALVLLLIGASLTLWAHEGLRARTIGAPSQLWNNQKVRGWGDGIRMANEFRWTGVGRGAFESPVNAYRSTDEGVRLVYPENLVVQLVSEWGFPVGLALLLLALARAARLTPLIIKLPPGTVGAACAVLAVVVHELVDFGLEMPGVAFPTVVALGVVTGSLAADERRTTRARGWRLPLRATLPFVAGWALLLPVAASASQHTLDRDWDRLRKSDDPTALKAALQRHPADDYLELVAAQRAFAGAKLESMRHLNRALLLHPYNWQAHRMAARILSAWQRPAQAALEYRLAHEDGLSLDINELVRVLGAHVVEAAPQTPPALLDLARALYEIGRAGEADQAAARAVELADAREPILCKRAELALAANKAPQLAAAGKALAAESTQPESFVLAARALSAAGDRAGSNAAIDAGLKLHPREGLLFLSGARLRFDAADYAGARALLARAGKASSLSLDERKAAEDLLAETAEKEGDPATAMLARARSRMIGERIRDMSFSHDSK